MIMMMMMMMTMMTNRHAGKELEEEVVVSMMHSKQRETQRPSNLCTVQSLLRGMSSLFVFYCPPAMLEWK